MDTGNIIAFLKKFSFGRLIGSGIVLRVLIAIVDGILILKLMNYLILTSTYLGLH